VFTISSSGPKKSEAKLANRHSSLSQNLLAIRSVMVLQFTSKHSRQPSGIYGVVVLPPSKRQRTIWSDYGRLAFKLHSLLCWPIVLVLNRHVPCVRSTILGLCDATSDVHVTIRTHEECQIKLLAKPWLERIGEKLDINLCPESF